MTKRCIIIGASHAAAVLAPSLRQEGWDGEILVIGNENHLPYHRPPLSKAFLVGEKTCDELSIRPQAFYDKNEIRFLNGHVSSINRVDQTLTLVNKEVLHYDKLAICTGARVRQLNFPGDQLAGIHYLRNIEDVQGIQKDIQPGKRAVIIGGGYIGLEAASALNKLGLAVTVLEMSSRVLQRVTAPQLSAFYTRIHTEEGVNIVTNVSLSEIRGKRRAEEVIGDNGEVYPADIVIIGVGVIPNVELAQEAGIAVDNGIIVDQSCMTQDPNIYAAGDCTRHYNKIYDRDLRLESVPNAGEQAKVAASAICGGDKIYNTMPWFWSDQYDMKLQIAGLSEGYDEVLLRGDSNHGRSFAAFYFKDGRLIAADCVNRPQEFMLAKKVISQGLDIDPKRLVDEEIPAKELLQI